MTFSRSLKLHLWHLYPASIVFLIQHEIGSGANSRFDFQPKTQLHDAFLGRGRKLWLWQALDNALNMPSAWRKWSMFATKRENVLVPGQLQHNELILAPSSYGSDDHVIASLPSRHPGLLVGAWKITV